MEFKKYLEQNTIGTHNDGPGAPYLTSDMSGSEQPNSNYGGRPNWLPSYDMGLPTVSKSSKIMTVERNRNPINVLLQDGTRLHFTYDEFKRIQGSEPQAGKIMTVTFQRNPNDESETPSKIQGCMVT